MSAISISQVQIEAAKSSFTARFAYFQALRATVQVLEGKSRKEVAQAAGRSHRYLSTKITISIRHLAFAYLQGAEPELYKGWSATVMREHSADEELYSRFYAKCDELANISEEDNRAKLLALAQAIIPVLEEHHRSMVSDQANQKTQELNEYASKFKDLDQILLKDASLEQIKESLRLKGIGVGFMDAEKRKNMSEAAKKAHARKNQYRR